METDDKWIMRGLPEDDPNCLHSAEELLEYVRKVGFLPLFRNEIHGFSAEEHVAPGHWWTDDEQLDPWCWRMTLARSGDVAYGKFFDGKACFVSKECFPLLACVRRDGYDFDSRADEGLAKPEDKRVMALLDGGIARDTAWLRRESGLNARFEGVITRLMRQTYALVSDFSQKINRLGQPYGWHVSVYSTPEALWGREFVTGAYRLGAAGALEAIMLKLSEVYPQALARTITEALGRG